jgi:serpin B
MSDTPLYLSTVVHKTYIRVDEQGTEAAAVTGGGMMPTSAPPTIEVDRPFAFTISDRDTGTILFLGTVEDPRG